MNSAHVTREQVIALRRKYAVLSELRASRESAISQGLSEFPPEQKAPRREIMRALAAEFPGSLRELDEASAEELHHRVVAIDEALSTPRADGWIEAAILFHTGLREALRLRRHSLGVPAFWAESDRERISRPPTGRLLDVVWTEVARRLGVTPRAAERLVYPRAPARGERI